MGITHSEYWVSWFITSCINVAILNSMQIVCGYCFDIKFISNTPIIIIFLFFFSFGVSI